MIGYIEKYVRLSFLVRPGYSFIAACVLCTWLLIFAWKIFSGAWLVGVMITIIAVTIAVPVGFLFNAEDMGISKKKEKIRELRTFLELEGQ